MKRRAAEGGGDKHLLEEMQVILQPTLTECTESNNAHTYTRRENSHLNTNRKCCTHAGFHAGPRLHWRFKAGFSSGGACKKNIAERRNRRYEVGISVTALNWNWLPQILSLRWRLKEKKKSLRVVVPHVQLVKSDLLLPLAVWCEIFFYLKE